MSDIQDAAPVRAGQTSAQVHAFVAPGPARDAAAAPVERHEGDDVQTQPSVAERLRPSLVVVPMIVGGLSGAVLALATFLVLNELWPVQDTRVPAIANRMLSADQRADMQERTLRAAEVDLVRLFGANAGMEQRIKQQDARTTDAVTDMDAARRELRGVIGTRSPVFGVAVAQLGAAIAAGQPFEMEWVNVFVLTADDPALRARIVPLTASARSGIDTSAKLRASLVLVARERGVPHVAETGIIDRNMMMLQTVVGLPLGFSTEEVMANTLIGTADQQLANGDVTGALETLGRLPEPYGSWLATWMDAARRHASAHAIVAELTAVARDRLRNNAAHSATGSR